MPIAAIAVGTLTGNTRAAPPLQPDELLLIYDAGQAASRELAAYYARRRGVPEEHLCPLRLDEAQEEIAPALFEQSIRQPIRDYLDQHGLRESVRCLVMFYGLPIRVSARSATEQEKALIEERWTLFSKALDELERQTNKLDILAGQTPPPLNPRIPKEEDYPSLLQRYQNSKMAAAQQFAKPPADQTQSAGLQNFLNTLRQTEGINAVAESLRLAPDPSQNTARQQLVQMREATRRANSQIQRHLARPPADASRKEAYKLIQQYHGLVGLLARIHEDITLLRPEETNAAVDSELMLLWWDSDYPRYRWVPNTLNWRWRTNPANAFRLALPQWSRPVLMVSRIDAGSPKVARRMIDDAISTEARSMTGTVYLDARGLKPDAGAGQYDYDLRKCAQMLWNHTNLTVRLDTKEPVYQPGQCPNTMLYCGWYSLRHYVDAFDFVPGAVGYHIASFEAISLKNPSDGGWCRNMLQDGITATLGPVAEPYLQSFPLPRDFFGLLVTGRFTLAECYAYTVTFNSWMQMLLGDPLYRPFARKPLIQIDQVFLPNEIPNEFKTATSSQAAQSGPAIPSP